MARKHKHEDHANHEAWAIPYGDLITLLLAFFVVMYAISSVNEGKYRVLSVALNEAFGGTPKAINPIQIGKLQPVNSPSESGPPMPLSGPRGPLVPIPQRRWTHLPRVREQVKGGYERPLLAADRSEVVRAQQQLRDISTKLQDQLKPLIDRGLVSVTQNDLWVEVAIKSDILFAVGVATPSAAAVRVLNQLADTLAPAPNAIRVEGHTDNRPIRTTQFPSNWELSSSRAGSVVRIFETRGVGSIRQSTIGFADQRPMADNGTPEGRNANRRVVIKILADLPDEEPSDKYAPPLPQSLTRPGG